MLLSCCLYSKFDWSVLFEKYPLLCLKVIYFTQLLILDLHLQYLDENKSWILKIIENQSTGKLSECAEWVRFPLFWQCIVIKLCLWVVSTISHSANVGSLVCLDFFLEIRRDEIWRINRSPISHQVVCFPFTEALSLALYIFSFIQKKKKSNHFTYGNFVQLLVNNMS